MGKGSGNCDRPGISLVVTDNTEPKATLSMNAAGIKTTLEFQRVEHRWFTKDDLVTFHKKKEGWIVGTYSAPIREACVEYGITSTIEGEPISFPSLKAAQQAVQDVSLEAGLNIDSRLTRQGWTAYKIGDLPLAIRKEKDHWRALNVPSAPLPPSLEKHFNSTKEFRDTWYPRALALPITRPGRPLIRL